MREVTLDAPIDVWPRLVRLPYGVLGIQAIIALMLLQAMVLLLVLRLIRDFAALIHALMNRAVTLTTEGIVILTNASPWSKKE